MAQTTRGSADKSGAPVSSSETRAQTAVFIRDGEYWTVGFSGLTFALKDLKGLSYVQRLLNHPGEEFHSLDLLHGGIETSPEGRQKSLGRPEGTDSIGGLGDAGEMLDTRAKLEYKLQIDKLNVELEDLRDRGNLKRAEEVESEIDFLRRELARALGLGGRDRRAGSTAERARLNVSRAIKAALQKILERDSNFGEMLNRTIRTGSFCCYSVNSNTTLTWKFSAESHKTAEAIHDTEPLLFRRDAVSFSSITSPTLFVGRESERAVLLRLLEHGLRSEGRVAMIGGPAGVGKSRMAREICIEAEGKGFLTLVGSCYDRDDSVPFLPIVEVLESASLRSSSPEAFRRWLGDDAGEISRLMPQLGRIFSDIPPPLETSTEHSRRALFNSVVALLGRAAADGPVLLVFEDLQWADEGTLSLLSHLVRSTSRLPLTVLGTYRDGDLDPAGPLSRTLDELTRSHLLERMNLTGLSKAGVGDMIRGLSEQEPPPSVVDLVYSHTEGNPFFVEELFKHLSERGRLLDATGKFRGNLKLGNFEVPQSVKLVLDRILVRLSEETQKILGTAAVIGSAFTFQLLEAATRVEPDALLDCIEEAEKSNLISSRLDYPEALFQFSHELARQTVLAGMSAPRRQRIHLNVAEAIQRVYASAPEDQANNLAHHLWNAGKIADADKTVKYLGIAARRALLLGAYDAALRLLQNALELLSNSQATPERSRLELDIRIDHGVALLVVNGWYAPEVGDTYRRAHELCHELGVVDDPRLFSVLFGLWMHHLVRGEHKEARKFAEESHRLAIQIDDERLRVHALWAVGCSQHFMGEIAAAHATHDALISEHRAERRVGGLFLFGQDPLVSCLFFDAVSLWILGFLEQSRAREMEADALARKLEHPFTLTWYLANDSMFCQLRRDYKSADARIDEVIPICEEHRLTHNLGIARGLQGMSLVAQGKVPMPRLAGDSSQIANAPAGHDLFQPWARGALAETFTRMGDPRTALTMVEEALGLVERIDERFFEAELHRIKGEAILAGGVQEKMSLESSLASAEQSFLNAIAIAVRQDARIFRLRAAMSLGKMQLKSDRPFAAKDTLRGAYDSFSEGFDNPELVEARNLLKELGE